MKTLLVTKLVRVVDHIATGANVWMDRKAREVSLRKVGKRMGLSPSYLSDLERGRRNWTEDLVRRYQEAVK